MEYKGFKIDIYKEVERGYYWSIMRIKDGWLLSDSYNPSLKNKSEAIEECKIIIDDYLENPEKYED